MYSAAVIMKYECPGRIHSLFRRPFKLACQASRSAGFRGRFTSRVRVEESPLKKKCVDCDFTNGLSVTFKTGSNQISFAATNFLFRASHF